MKDTFFFDGDFRKNPKTGCFCAVCQKDLKKIAGYVYIGDCASEAVNINELDGTELKAPIGSECLKKIPEAYVEL